MVLLSFENRACHLFAMPENEEVAGEGEENVEEGEEEGGRRMKVK